MKVLVTGGSGQLGRALLASAPPCVETRSPSSKECDFVDPASIRALVFDIRPDLVINAAAYTAVDRAESEEERAHAINAQAVAALVEALDSIGGKLVHVSTDYVFDGTSTRAYLPNDPRGPSSAYGRTKAAGEDALRRSDLLVRTSWIYSAGGVNFVRTMLRLMRKRGGVRVVADQIGAPTWAKSLAETLWALAEKDAQGTFHHSDAGIASWYDFAIAIQEEALALGMLERKVTVTPISSADYPTPAKRPPFALLDSSATRALLGDDYTHWRVNLRRMLEEERALG